MHSARLNAISICHTTKFAPIGVEEGDISKAKLPKSQRTQNFHELTLASRQIQIDRPFFLKILDQSLSLYHTQLLGMEGTKPYFFVKSQ